MKNKYKLFEKAPELLDEPEVQELLSYCENLEDELIDLRFEKDKNKELILLDMVREVLKSCTALEKQQMEHERFGYELPDYQQSIQDLKNYILEVCKESKIWL
ncbi:hypothetical protein [Flavobacterium sp.]|uniref:hypothetical protein n=1 Tax=Flavobacterium sp. TaxID=239 RepID=UPI003D0DEA82